ncbi:cupin domain-containing protein [Bdellovibrio sp. NC01]|uniref:cupin domain-containing protein n=1 Tax=Bdellovibrio sp. NC01 TaxID=2220073 RepID=UPI00115BB92E|nr:cupin [Bdellovibrio sp. NC01]
MLGKNFSKADEVREFPMGKLELIKFGDKTVAKATLQPGWVWSKSVKDIAQTESCEVAHFQYHASGTLHVKMDNGKELEFKPGEVSMIPPGHDAWVVGNEPVVLIDFQGMVDYAKPAQHTH